MHHHAAGAAPRLNQNPRSGTTAPVLAPSAGRQRPGFGGGVPCGAGRVPGSAPRPGRISQLIPTMSPGRRATFTRGDRGAGGRSDLPRSRGRSAVWPSPGRLLRGSGCWGKGWGAGCQSPWKLPSSTTQTVTGGPRGQAHGEDLSWGMLVLAAVRGPPSGVSDPAPCSEATSPAQAAGLLSAPRPARPAEECLKSPPETHSVATHCPGLTTFTKSIRSFYFYSVVLFLGCLSAVSCMK